MCHPHEGGKDVSHASIGAGGGGLRAELHQRPLCESLETRRLLSYDTYFWFGPPGTGSGGNAVAVEGQNIWVNFSGTGSGTGLEVNYSLSGTAQEGDDYTVNHNGSVYVAIADDGGWINIAALHDEWIEGDETVVFTLLPGQGYEVGVHPDWQAWYDQVKQPGDEPDQITVTIKQAALALTAVEGDAPQQGGDGYDANTKTLTITKPAGGSGWVTEGISAGLRAPDGTLQQNPQLDASFIDGPPGIEPTIQSSLSLDGKKIRFNISATVQTTPGTYTLRIIWDAENPVWTDITVVIREP